MPLTTEQKNKYNKIISMMELVAKDTLTVAQAREYFEFLTKVVREIRDELSRRMMSHETGMANDLRLNLEHLKNKINDFESETTRDIRNKLEQFIKNKEKEDQVRSVLALKEISELEKSVKALVNDYVSLENKLSALGEKIVSPTPVLVRDLLETLTGNQRLKKEAVQGLEELETKLRNEIKKSGGTKNIGGLQGLFLHIDGEDKWLIQRLDLVAGDNITINHSVVNGLDTITIASSGGGGGFTIETPTGAVDGSNDTFTVSAEPAYIVADGIAYFSGAGYVFNPPDEIVLDVPPSQYIRVFV